MCLGEVQASPLRCHSSQWSAAARKARESECLRMEGFSLIELMVALLIGSVVLISIVGFTAGVLRSDNAAAIRGLGAFQGVELIEHWEQSGLLPPAAVASGGKQYQVAAANFCNGNAAIQQPCPSSLSSLPAAERPAGKQVELSWSDQAGSHKVKMTYIGLAP